MSDLTPNPASSWLTLFGVQCAVSATMIAFSITQLARGQPTEVYLPVLTGAVGYWLPSPKQGTQTYVRDLPAPALPGTTDPVPGAMPTRQEVFHMDV